ncbi:MAG: hypothetical protein AB7E72_02835 [Lysobacterales bacterium]
MSIGCDGNRAGWRRWLPLLAASLLVCSVLPAQPVALVETELPPPVTGDGASGDSFGIAVAVDGNVAVIGAYGDSIAAPGATFGIGQGSAYVYERSGAGWVQSQKLSPQPTGEDGDNFGAALGMAENFLVIGSPRRRVAQAQEAGSIFVYGRSAQGYLLRQLISPPVVEVDQRFGAAIAVWQDRLAVGAPRAGSGRVDLYRRDGNGQYQFEQSMSAPDSPVAARFGTAVAMADGVLLIGAPDADGSGAVYRSELSGNAWTALARLPLTARTGDQLGAAIAASRGLALIGTPGAGSGEVRLLRIAGGAQQLAVLTRPGGLPADRFGSAVSLDETRALISAGAALSGEGVVSVYQRNGQTLAEIAQLDIANGGLSNRFGSALALTADGALIGADLDRVGPNRGQGAVHWYLTQGAAVTSAGRLDSGDGAMFDRYGTAVAVNGDVAMVGAYLEQTDAGAEAGAVHWFERSGSQWSYGGRLDAPDAAIEDRFGISVAIDGDYAVIGAYWDVIGDNVDQGSAYVFRREGGDWLFDTKLTANDGRARDLFGFAVAIKGEVVLVGARGARVPLTDQGKAYVFRRNPAGWQQEAGLDLPEPVSSAYFGASVALADDRAIVGAPGFTKTPGPLSAGGVFVFARSGSSWVSIAGTQAPVPKANAAFGFSISADGERVLVGAFQDRNASQGAAYVYRLPDLVYDGALLAALPQSGEGLGISVAIDGDLAVLGGSGFDVGSAANQGAVRLFRRGPNGWSEAQQWLAAGGAAGDGFGRAVAMDGASVLVGAPGRGVDNPLEGTAYVQTVDQLFGDGFESVTPTGSF